MVPPKLQRGVWRHYREGQCDDKNPSPEWHVAADKAIVAVAVLEGRMTSEQAVAKVQKTIIWARERLGKESPD